MSRPLSLGRGVYEIARKDILLEWKSRARASATLFFAVLIMLLFSFAVGPQHKILEKIAPGFLLLAILLASVLSLGESLRVEHDNSALEGLRLLPVDMRTVFLGKALVNMLTLWGMTFVLVPIAVALYDCHLVLGWLRLELVLLLGAAAISAPGTLYSHIATQARARDILLPLLLFPVLVPSLVAAVKAASLVMQGDPMGQLASWLSLLIAFNGLYWPLCSLLFGYVAEE